MQNTTRNAAQREGARPAPQNDAQKIAEHMARLNIAGSPRNYELLHEAGCGRNTALATDISALGSHPAQARLDELGLKYRLVSHCGLAAETAGTEASKL